MRDVDGARRDGVLAAIRQQAAAIAAKRRVGGFTVLAWRRGWFHHPLTHSRDPPHSKPALCRAPPSCPPPPPAPCCCSCASRWTSSIRTHPPPAAPRWWVRSGRRSGVRGWGGGGAGAVARSQPPNGSLCEAPTSITRYLPPWTLRNTLPLHCFPAPRSTVPQRLGLHQLGDGQPGLPRLPVHGAGVWDVGVGWGRGMVPGGRWRYVVEGRSPCTRCSLKPPDPFSLHILLLPAPLTLAIPHPHPPHPHPTHTHTHTTDRPHRHDLHPLPQRLEPPPRRARLRRRHRAGGARAGAHPGQAGGGRRRRGGRRGQGGALMRRGGVRGAEEPHCQMQCISFPIYLLPGSLQPLLLLLCTHMPHNFGLLLGGWGT